MEDDPPRRPGTRSESARPTRPPRPPAPLFMEPTVPPARHRSQPADRVQAETGHGAEQAAPAEPGPEPTPGDTPAGSDTATDTAARERTVRKQASEPAEPPATKDAPSSGRTTEATPPDRKTSSPKSATASKTTAAKRTPTARTTPAANRATAGSHTRSTRPVDKATQGNETAAKAGPVKKAAAKKTASPRKAAKTTTTPASRPVTATVTRPAPPWWARVPADPAEVPEWLAHAAVERYGTSADRYLRWLRETYPHAGPDALARIAVARFHRRPWYTALAGRAGIAGLVATQAELVLHVAAAYGHDPTDPARVPELVALIPSRGLVGSLAGRFAGRLIPGAGLVAGLLADRGALDDVARRAIAHYGAGSGQER